MKRPNELPAAPKCKKRRGRRKSKSERLAQSVPGSHCQFELQQLLQIRSSCAWDKAQTLAMKIGTLEARACVVCFILEKYEAPKAAAHHTKRLQLRGNDVIQILVSNATISSLLMAQFIVELDEKTLSIGDRLTQFLWPWLLQSMDKKDEKAMMKAAVHLMLHPTASDDIKMYEKKERGRRLQCALVTHCLQTGRLLHLVPVHARALAEEVNVDCVSFAAGTNDEKTIVRADRDREQELQRRKDVARRVQNVLRLMWPDARVMLFGSSVTGLLPDPDKDEQKPADVDLCALLPSAPQFHQETAPLVIEVKEHLAIYFLPDSMDENEHSVIAVTGARIPIVHFRDPTTGLSCDLCVNNVSALWNTRLLRWFLYGGGSVHSPEQKRQLQHVRQLCIWLRKWRQAKMRLIGGAVSSYGLVLLAIYYLQRNGILPVLDCSAHVNQEESSLCTLTEDGIDKKLEATEKKLTSVKDNTTEVRDWLALRRGFFRFYACEFDYERTIVSLRIDGILPKTSKGWFRENDNRLCLEDPVETERDLGKLCSRRALGRLRCAFAHACIALSCKDKTDVGSDILQEDVEANLLAKWAYEDEAPRTEGLQTECIDFGDFAS